VTRRGPALVDLALALVAVLVVVIVWRTDMATGNPLNARLTSAYVP
jgi:hypothetical protein